MSKQETQKIISRYTDLFPHHYATFLEKMAGSTLPEVKLDPLKNQISA